MKVFIVVAVFNRKDFTLQCLQLLKTQSYADFEIIVVDDGSTDGTKVEIQRYHPDVILVQGDGNWWWTKSMNKGFEAAIDNGADLVITLNNDIVFNLRLIEELVQLHKKNPNSIIGCLNLIKKEKEYIFFSGIKKIIWWKAKEVKYHRAFTTLVHKMQGIHSTQCLNGRGTVIPIRIFKELGGYDEDRYPQYASDYDLTLRANEQGFKCLISYDVVVHSFIEETGQGKSFIKQSWGSFLKSFLNPYSQTSLKIWYRYYRSHAPYGVHILGFIFQQLRTLYAFYKKRNLLLNID